MNAERSNEQPAADPAADKYGRLMRLADLFDTSGEEMRTRAKLGDAVLRDEDVAASEELSPKTYAQVEEDVRQATSGKRGLLARSIELDADALMVRATVLTYRWIDDLQEAAYKTLGSIAGRAIGYLAPEVALGGAIVSAGLIETDALDRDGVAAYLNELAENNPELLDHVSSGGGLLDSLQMRSLLTTGVLAGASGADAGRGGLRAAGVDPLLSDAGAALRDIAGGFTTAPSADADAAVEPADVEPAPRSVEDLMTVLAQSRQSVTVRKVGPSRYIAFLPGPDGARKGRLRLVGGDHSTYTAQVVAAIERAVAESEDVARVMLVGSAQGGVTAAEVAATVRSDSFAVDQVVTAGAPSSQVHLIPEGTRVLSLEDRADPVALLGSLINAGVSNRMTVVFDGGNGRGEGAYVAGGRAADAASHPDLRAEIAHIHELGYLAG
ncbi:MAG: hypothetical protein ACR2JD_07800 [Nocardioides sp.]